MKIPASDRSFARGIRALDEGKTLEALAFFEASLKLHDTALNPARRERYSSYYGYCLAAALGRTREGLSLCLQAAAGEFFSPEILLNLARVQLLAGQRRKAWETLLQGLSLDSEHEALRTEAKRMGIRKPRAIPFLDRAHPLNKVAGRIGTKRRASRRN